MTNTTKAFMVGTKVYYTGDVANVDGHGEIIEYVNDRKWKTESYTIQLEDGRVFKGVMPSGFEGPGHRWELMSERATARSERLRALSGNGQ